MIRLPYFACFLRLLGTLFLPAAVWALTTPTTPQVARETPAVPETAVPAESPAPAPPSPRAIQADPAPPVVSNAPPGPAAASPAHPDAAFASALKAYNAGAFDDARRELLAIIEQGKLSAPLAHNLGNIEFRRGHAGQAVLWYKRALVLQPYSPETLQNLRTLRRLSGFLSFDPLILSVSHLKRYQVETVLISTAWVVGLVIFWLVWLTPRRGRRWPLVTLLTILLPILALGGFLTWVLRNDPHPLNKRMIVSNKEADAFAAPAEASSRVMSLPAGSEVVPLETRGNWIYCIMPGGAEGQPLRGWIRSTKLEPLWPWPGGI